MMKVRSKKVQHTCSMCGTVYEFEWKAGTPLPKNFPFCSSRCKAVDLGKWLNEAYVISTPLPELTELEMRLDDELD